MCSVYCVKAVATKDKVLQLKQNALFLLLTAD